MAIRNRLLSHLFSLSVINLIIGWGGNFYFVKVFFFFVIGGMALWLILRYDRLVVNRFYAVLLLVVLILIGYKSSGGFRGIICSRSIAMTVLPIIFGMLVYNVVDYVDVGVFVGYLRLFFVASVVFVFFQYFGFWGINQVFFYNEFVGRVEGTTAFVGLSSSPFYMGSQLAIITPIIGGCEKGRALCLVYAVFSFVSQQRAYFVTVVGVWLKRYFSVNVILLMVLVLFLISCYVLIWYDGLGVFRGYDSDRMVLYLSGLLYVINNPMGAGGFAEYFVEVPNLLDQYVFLRKYSDLLMAYPPHNIVINIAVQYGVLFLALVVWFVYRVYRLSNVYSRAFICGLVVALFHNLSFLYGDYFSWVVLAFAFRVHATDSAGITDY